MKGKTSLFNNRNSSLSFHLNLQLFAAKRISDTGINIQNRLTNQKLKNLVGELYREGAAVGDGSAMAAASEQVRTGKLVGGKNHIIKIEQRVSNLNNIVKTQNLNKSDTKYANKLMADMIKSLKGEY